MLSLIPRMSDSDASGLMNRADPRLEGSVFDNPVNQLTLHPTPLMLMDKGKRKETDLFQNKSQNVPSPPV